MENKSLIVLNKVILNKNISIDSENNKTESENNSHSLLYYDKYSRKIFDVNENGIKIYNRKAKNLKSNILINIPKESLLSIITDKDLKYLICLLISKQGDDIFKTKLILINTFDKKFFDKIEENFNYILGMFFIGKINNLINFDNNNPNELYDFCIVNCDKVLFYGIEKKSNGDEYCKKLSTLNTSGNILIKDFCYDYKHKILGLVKTDLSISFVILTNRKNYKYMITPKIGYIKTLKEKISLKGMFRKVSEDQKKSIKAHFDNLDRYTDTQFYVETIYNSLYLICLCYENNKIYINELENLNNIKANISIDYPQHARCSALQVIDNLIIVHNFLTKLIVVIDIKSKIPILRTFRVNFPYQNNLHINGEILEERRIFNKNRLISVHGGTLFNIVFNGKVYDELTDADFKKRKKKKMNLKDKNAKKDEEMNRYDVLVNLLHRKGTNNLILNILYRLILNDDEKPIYIIDFFKELIKLDNKTKEKVEIISDKKLAKKELYDSNTPYEVPKPNNIILARKNYIKQLDILINLFDKFSKKDTDEINNNNNEIKKTDKNNIELDEKLALRIIFYMSQFYNQIIIQKMEIKPCFHSIILKYIKILKQKEKIINLIIHKNIPDSPEIGQYLLELSMNKNDIHWREYENLGLKILGKLKKHDIIIDFLLKKGKIAKAINYMNEIFINLTYEQVEKIFTDNKDILEQNKDLLLNYIK
jgi:hypothetical protein